MRLTPEVGAVIGPVRQQDVLFPGEYPGQRDGVRRDIGPVLAKNAPVRAMNRSHDLFGKRKPQIGRQREAVRIFPLFFRRCVDLRMLQSQEVGSEGAHVIDIFVSVHVPDPASLAAANKGRIRPEGEKGRRAGSVNAVGNVLLRFLKQPV
jgi:hypothetical protein